jgi:hypothetical protein
MEKNYFYGILTICSCPRLLGEHVEKVSKKLTAQIVRLLHLKWNEKYFLLVPGRDSNFDRPWYKFFELCNFELLLHRNAHHVR